MNESLDLFDDSNLIDVNIFKDSDRDKEAKESKEKEDKEKKVTNTLNPMEGLEYDEPEEKEEEEVGNKVEEDTSEDEDSDNEDESTDEEKELLQKIIDLKEVGALFLPEDYEVESLEKAVQDSEAFRNEVATKAVFNKLPDVEIPGLGNSRELFLYMFEHGGEDIQKFKETFGSESFDAKKFDLSKEEDRRKVLETYYQKKGFNDVKTKKMVDKVFDDLEDEAESAEALGELTKMDAQAKQAHLKELENQKVQRQKDAQEAYNTMYGILEKNTIVGGYPITKEEKSKALNSIYTQVNVGGDIMSDFDYRLNALVLRNPELTLALSAFLNTLSQDKNKNLYFDLSKFEKKEKSKAVRDLKDTTSRIAAGKKNFTSTSEGGNTSKKGFKWDNVIDYSEI